MDSAKINTNLVDNYLGLLKNLSPDNKLELISRLSNSMKTAKNIESDSLKSLYGAYHSKKNADEIIDDLKQSRTFNRNRAVL